MTSRRRRGRQSNNHRGSARRAEGNKAIDAMRQNDGRSATGGMIRSRTPLRGHDVGCMMSSAANLPGHDVVTQRCLLCVVQAVVLILLRAFAATAQAAITEAEFAGLRQQRDAGAQTLRRNLIDAINRRCQRPTD